MKAFWPSRVPFFKRLRLNRLESEKRKIALADGTMSETEGSYAILRMPYLSKRIGGFIETFSGLNEIILGVEALVELRVVFDYCAKRVKIEGCP